MSEPEAPQDNLAADSSLEIATKWLLARVFVAITVLMVLFCGMFPFDFAFKPATALSEIHRRFDLTTNQLYTAGDGQENVIFFLPFGFALGALFYGASLGKKIQNPILRLIVRLLLATFLSTVLSSIVETSQVYLESRDPSLADIITNTTGGAIGFLIFAAIGRPLMTLLTDIALAIRALAGPWTYGVATVAWAMIILALPLRARHVNRLTDWDTGYPLVIGNETTMNRGWKGQISGVWLADRALDDAEVSRVLTGIDPATLLGKNLVANYQLSGPGPYADQAGRGSALNWTTDDPKKTFDGIAVIQSRFGAPMTWDWWLRTPDKGMQSAGVAIRTANAFTLVCDEATNDLGQNDNYPRLISISDGPWRCNLQLNQDAGNLLLRVRTIATGWAGMDPEFYIPGVFTDTKPHRLIVTYNHGQVGFACDQIQTHFSIHLTPETKLVWRIYPRTGWRYRLDSPGQSLYGLIYRFLVMLPLGLLLGAWFRKQWIGAVCFLLVVGVALEVIASLFAGYSMHTIAGLFVTLLVGLMGIKAVYRARRRLV